MDGAQDIVGGILILVGAFFYVVGAIGIYRMPDVFTRMHAASVSETLGVGFLVIGMMVLAGFTLVSAKLAIILAVILFTSPIATHALAQAALHEGISPYGVGDEVLIGPGAHPGPERIGTSNKRNIGKKRSTKSKTRKSTKTAVTRRKPAARTARSRTKKAARTNRGRRS